MKKIFMILSTLLILCSTAFAETEVFHDKNYDMKSIKDIYIVNSYSLYNEPTLEFMPQPNAEELILERLYQIQQENTKYSGYNLYDARENPDTVPDDAVIMEVKLSYTGYYSINYGGYWTESIAETGHYNWNPYSKKWEYQVRPVYYQTWVPTSTNYKSSCISSIYLYDKKTDKKIFDLYNYRVGIGTSPFAQMKRTAQSFWKEFHKVAKTK